MIVIVPHQDLELKIIKTQKELIKKLYDKANKIIPYTAMPLWINTDFTSVEEAKKAIQKIIILPAEYDEIKNEIICPVEISIKDGNSDSSLSLVKFLAKGNKAEADLFPLEVKIFRLGECTSPSPNVFELSNIKWVKLT